MFGYNGTLTECHQFCGSPLHNSLRPVTFKVRIIIKKCKTPVLKTVKLIIFLVIMEIKPILKQKKDNIAYSSEQYLHCATPLFNINVFVKY